MVTHTPPVHKIVSALAARRQFGQIVRRAGGGRTSFVVDRRREPQVVIMGIKDFVAALRATKNLPAIRAAARKTGENRPRKTDRATATLPPPGRWQSTG